MSPRKVSTKRAWSFSIGRISGIEIRIHVTFFLLVPLFALAGTAEGGPGVVGGVLWLVVIFGCVLLHELAHCFVGRPRGAVVHEIELFPLGGVSKLEQLPDDPRDEFAMAIAGPLASVAIAAVAAAVAAALGRSLWPIDLYEGSFIARLAWLNLLLAVFNLLPAFPLDGGRVFRAMLERWLDLERATHVAARVGRFVAVVFFVVGLFWNPWLVIIAVFVYFGASAEEAATVLHVRLASQSVADLMFIAPIVVDPATSSEALRALLRRSAQRVFPVVGEQGYEGLVDATAIERSVVGDTAAELIERGQPVVASTDEVEARIPELVSARTHALAVLDGPTVIGVLRVEEIQHLLEPARPRHGAR